MRFIHIILFLVSGIYCFAQDIEFKANGPKYVRVGEQFQIQYTVNKSVDDFRPPGFDDFDFLGGPMQGSSTNVTWTNGKTVRIQTFTFTYYLRAKNPGKFTLGPATVLYKKSEVKSNSIHIEVVGSSSSGTTQNPSSSQNSATASSSNGKDLFVSLVSSKKTAYVGEGVTAWVKIYTKVSLSDIDMANYKGPVFSGFYKQNQEVPPLRGLEREKVGNDIYHSGVLQKVVLFPQKSGKITIQPFDLTVYTQKQVRRQSRSIFDDLLGPSYTSVPVKLKSKPVTLNVKPLPAGQPQGFTGAVGTYTIKGSLNKNKVKTNDAVSFKVTVSGTGNIKLIESLDYSFPSTMTAYDPIVKTNINSSGLSGSKTFEITAQPKHPGTIEIKPFKLVYFDTKSKSYKTIQTQPFTLEVERGEGDSSSVVISNLSKEDVELLGSDIRYIKVMNKLNAKGDYLINSLWYRLLYVLLLLLFVSVLVIKREQIKRNANVTQTKHKKAGKIAGKRFKYAKDLLKQDKIDLFYEEVSKAIWGYLSDKLNISQSALSTDRAREELEKYNVDKKLIEELFNTISHCEFARYAPGAAGKAPEEVYNEAVNLLMQIEQNF